MTLSLKPGDDKYMLFNDLRRDDDGHWYMEYGPHRLKWFSRHDPAVVNRMCLINRWRLQEDLWALEKDSELVIGTERVFFIRGIPVCVASPWVISAPKECARIIEDALSLKLIYRDNIYDLFTMRPQFPYAYRQSWGDGPYYCNFSEVDGPSWTDRRVVELTNYIDEFPVAYRNASSRHDYFDRDALLEEFDWAAKRCCYCGEVSRWFFEVKPAEFSWGLKGRCSSRHSYQWSQEVERAFKGYRLCESCGAHEVRSSVISEEIDAWVKGKVKGKAAERKARQAKRTARKQSLQLRMIRKAMSSARKSLKTVDREAWPSLQKEFKQAANLLE